MKGLGDLGETSRKSWKEAAATGAEQRAAPILTFPVCRCVCLCLYLCGWELAEGRKGGGVGRGLVSVTFAAWPFTH